MRFHLISFRSNGPESSPRERWGSSLLIRGQKRPLLEARGVQRFPFGGRYAYLSPELDGYRQRGCHFDHPAKTTLPNGLSSIRWRKASPASAKG